MIWNRARISRKRRFQSHSTNSLFEADSSRDN
ncbi:BnaC01g26950D [Brassica napus]|uniref:BnaC01g26950D protein n=1 Tax=Brassica napus TaxID=3708 RepID=A0A078FX48_BRANA|nr:BnaC01g26950D [Brassica napus]